MGRALSPHSPQTQPRVGPQNSWKSQDKDCPLPLLAHLTPGRGSLGSKAFQTPKKLMVSCSQKPLGYVNSKTMAPSVCLSCRLRAGAPGSWEPLIDTHTHYTHTTHTAPHATRT